MHPRTNGHTIRAVRQARGLRQDHLAHAAGITPGYLAHIEQGRRHPSPEVTGRIASELRVSTDLLTGQIPVVGWLRQAKGIEERDLAAAAGVMVKRLRRFEAGSEVPPADVLEALARRLGVEPVALQPVTTDAA